MPRDISGTYTLPGGINPVVAGTTIDTSWANPTMADIAAALTDSLSRTGLGGMTGAFRFADGSKPAPGIAWTNQTTVGFYRATTNDMRVAIANTDIEQWTPSLVTISPAVLMSSTLRLASALYMPNSVSIYFKDAALTDMPALTVNVSNEVLHGLGASWARHYFYCLGSIKFAIDAAAVAVTTNFTVTGNITGAASFFIVTAEVSGSVILVNNRSYYIRAADTTAYPVVGVDTLNQLNIGSIAWDSINFYVASAARGAFNNNGMFKAYGFGGGPVVLASAHEFSTTYAGNYICYFNHGNAAPAGGVFIQQYGFSSGSRGQNKYPLICVDATGAVAAFFSDGGLYNYSANNVNISDATLKRDIRDTEDFTPRVAKLAYKRFKYEGAKTEVVGLIAQDVEKIDPALVVTIEGVKGVLDKQLQDMINSVVVRLARRVAALEARP